MDNLTKTYLLTVLFLFVIKTNAQNFADEKFYLIDSLNLDELSLEDREVLDSSLTIYIRTNSEYERLQILTGICENLQSRYWENYQILLFNKFNFLLNSKVLDDKENYEKLYIHTLNNIALINLGISKLDISFEQANKGIKLADKYSDFDSKASLLNIIGGVYMKRKEYDLASEYFDKSLEIRIKNGDPVKIANSINNIGNLFLANGEKDKALNTFKRGVKIQKEINDKNGIIYSNYNIASVYKDLEKFDSARFVLLENLEFIDNNNYEKEMPDNLELLALVYFKKNNLLEAIKLLKESSEIRNRLGDEQKYLKNLNLISQSYFNLGLYDLSLSYNDMALGHALINKFTKEKENTFNIKIDNELAEGNIKEAYKTLDLIKKDTSLAILNSLKEGAIFNAEGKYVEAIPNFLEVFEINKETNQLNDEELEDLYSGLILALFSSENVDCIKFTDSLLTENLDLSNNTILLLIKVYMKFDEGSIKVEELFNIFYKTYVSKSNNANQIYELANLDTNIRDEVLEPEKEKDEFFNFKNVIFYLSIILNIVFFIFLIKKRNNRL